MTQPSGPRARPRYSVVIPTRNRFSTLASTLRTCTTQDHDSVEFVVADNCSIAATREIVRAVADERVRYTRSDEALSMSANWDRAVAVALGEWVLIVGDDDGLLPDALTRLDDYLIDARVDAIRWNQAYYGWPDNPIPGHSWYLQIPLGHGCVIRDAETVLSSVIRFDEPYTALPMAYNGAVRRSVIDKVAARVGRVFPSRFPDVFGAFAFAAVAGRFASLDHPLSMSGQSGASYGLAELFREAAPRAVDWQELNGRDKLRAAPEVPDIGSFPAAPVLDSYLVALDLGLLPESSARPGRAEIAARLAQDLHAADERLWRAGLAAIRDRLGGDARLERWFDTEIAAQAYVEPPPLGHGTSSTSQLADNHLHLDARKLGAFDVASAAKICALLAR